MNSHQATKSREEVDRYFLPCKIGGKSTSAILATGCPATFISKMLMQQLGLTNQLNTRISGNGYGLMGDRHRIVGVLDSVPIEFSTGIVCDMNVYVFENDHYDVLAIGTDLFDKFAVTLCPPKDGIKEVGFRNYNNGAEHSVPCLRYKHQIPPFAESVSCSPIYKLEIA